MLDKETIELSQSFLQKAFKTLENIPVYIQMDDYLVAVNRSYYAAFYSLKALEILDNYDSKKHSGVISRFRQQYIKTEICSNRYSNIIGKLQEAREVGDYNIIAEFSIDEAKEFYESAKDFVNEMQRLINNRIED
ncbi:MAG: HEPN domain-containing protein [Ruminococcaceae bacterium]|nr:HEPN domain-containing protein [Oscillospiraceae bacterium]